jgi:cathepsin B
MFVVALVALVAAVSAITNPNLAPLIDEELVRIVKESGASWEASLNNQFASWTLGDAKNILGSRLDDVFISQVPNVDTVVDAIPAAFDSRTQWPGAIHPIRNQEQCGSCWAFGATESLSDRFAIQTNVSTNVVLSPQDLVSCDNADGNEGCNGGYPIKPWQYMEATGVVSDPCYPYTSGGGVTGNCLLTSGHTTCPSGTGTVQYYKAASAYSVGSASNLPAIQTEIMTHGPIEVAFDVYQDFFSYTSGVYVHKTGSLAGGHAVKMIGWGVLNNVEYWSVANSWGTTWGMEGFFLIKRGVNECGIEAAAVAGLADTSSF